MYAGNLATCSLREFLFKKLSASESGRGGFLRVGVQLWPAGGATLSADGKSRQQLAGSLLGPESATVNLSNSQRANGLRTNQATRERSGGRRRRQTLNNKQFQTTSRAADKSPLIQIKAQKKGPDQIHKVIARLSRQT